MPATLCETSLDIVVEPSRKKWTGTECAALEESGVLQGQHLELVRGDLINKMGKSRPHGIALALTVHWLQDVFGRLYVQQEVNIDVSLEDNPTNYARAGIVDYWVLDAAGKRMIVHHEPVEGVYTSVWAYAEHESAAPLAAPDSPFHVRDAFPD